MPCVLVAIGAGLIYARHAATMDLSRPCNMAVALRSLTAFDTSRRSPSHFMPCASAIFAKVVIEVGDERFTLRPGDSILASRNVPHVWAYVGEKPGRMLMGFTPG